jgi:hypothetical protein
MTQSQLAKMTPQARAVWLSIEPLIKSWKLGDDVFCLHCDAVWIAEDLACDQDGYPTCPFCRNSNPLDFHHIPWWRQVQTATV